MIRCSDHRLARACEDFVEDTLLIPDYDLLVVPGGPQFLSALNYMPKFLWAGQRWMRFLIDAHEVKRVVLITHQDCGWYKRLHGMNEDHADRQKADLLDAAVHLRELDPALRVDCFYASLETGEVKFSAIK